MIIMKMMSDSKSKNIDDNDEYEEYLEAKASKKRKKFTRT